MLPSIQLLPLSRRIKQFDLASIERDQNVALVVEHLNLTRTWAYFLETCRSLDLSYHNLYHGKCMVLNSFEGCVTLNVPYSRTRAIVAAAILHDYNHSGGKFKDDYNIIVARTAFGNFHAILKELTQEEYEIGDECIACTQYPYVNSPRVISEKIIREADLMQIYELDLDLLKKQFRGLQQEVQISLGKTFTHQEYAAGQVDWYKKNVTWYTDWAKQKAKFHNVELRYSILEKLLAEET